MGCSPAFRVPTTPLAVHDDARDPAGIIGYHAGPMLRHVNS